MTSRDASQRLVDTAKAVLSRSIGIVEACREMVPLLHDLGEDVRRSAAGQVLRAVESETDSYPIGDQRQYWAPGALEERDRELESYLARVRNDIEDACRELVSRLEGVNRE